MNSDTALCWLRRDLRLDDHAALYTALCAHPRVVCVFLFDRLELHNHRQAKFVWHALDQIKQGLQARGSDLLIVQGDASNEICALAQRFAASVVYVAEDYEPAARARDQSVDQALAALGSRLEPVKDLVIFAGDEILAKNHTPYSVFTAYKNTWLARLNPAEWMPYDSLGQLSRLMPLPATPMPSLKQLGFQSSNLGGLGLPLGKSGAQQLLAAFDAHIADYQQQRDFPALDASSHLSPHLRFGTLSIRRAVALAAEYTGPGAACWLSELIWREFYQQLLWHHPRVAQESFKLKYRDLNYENNQTWFDAWRNGQTGFPLIDAAMRQLSQTGWMHNRLRMITASFLVKDLLIDWRWGERYFAETLLDFDLAANNGGWQWAASTGCDAQPYFRIFNPVTQSKRFDPDGRFIRRYLPELTELNNQDIHAPWLAKKLPAGFTLGRDYPVPMVEHAEQRQRALALFGR